MKTKIIIIISLLVMTSMLYAAPQECPDPHSVKLGIYPGWLPINSLDDEPATPEEIDTFQKTLKGFSNAEWSEDYLHGYGRCNYKSKIEVSLASENIPLNTRPQNSHWFWDGIVARCHSGTTAGCIFN